jgi:hypothetical protein
VAGTIVLAFAKSSAEFDGEAFSSTRLVGPLAAVLVGTLVLALAAAVASGMVQQIPRPLRLLALLGAGCLNALAAIEFVAEALDFLTDWEHWQELGFGTYEIAWTVTAISVSVLGIVGAVTLGRREWASKLRTPPVRERYVSLPWWR